MPHIQFVGILNITPDSFSDGGKFTDTSAALAHAKELFGQGATFVDIGAESTNPWSTPLTAQQEIERLQPVIPKLIDQFGSDAFTLDTYHPETLAWAIEQGMKPILNDVSGLHNTQMRKLVIDNDIRVVISHLPKSAQGLPVLAHTNKPINDIEQVVTELTQTAQELQQQGLSSDRVILDPGIGFGKTMPLNWQLLDFPQRVPGYATMLGYSRKRFLHTDPITGDELPDAIQLKQQAELSDANQHAYDQWLSTTHSNVLARISQSAQASQHDTYIRVHQIPQM